MIKLQKIKKNLMKILNVLTFLLLTSMALTGCGNKTTLSEDEYRAEVRRINNEITTISNDYTASLASIDSTDKQASLASTNKYSEELKSLCQEISALQAPEVFEDAQAKIKAGAEAIIEFSDFSMEITKLYDEGNLSKEEAENKSRELDARLADLTPKITDYYSTIAEITK